MAFGLFLRKRTTIGAQIRWLVVACTLPAWLLAVLVSYSAYQREYDALVQSTVQTADVLRGSVERELSTDIAILQTLASATSIDDRDFKRFHDQAQQVLKLSAGDNIILLDAQLHGLVSLAKPFGQPVPNLHLDRFPSVMKTGQPAVSDLFIGQISQRAQVAIAVPVMRQGRAIGRLEMVFSPERFGQLLQAQKLPPAWRSSVLDSQGNFVARNLDARHFIGQRAPQALLTHLQQDRLGSYQGISSDGVPIMGCFSLSPRFGWAVAVGIPENWLQAELRRTLALYTAGAVGLLLWGMALAGTLGRRIAQPIQALVMPALAIGRGEAASIAPCLLREADEVGQALGQAQSLLLAREQARQQAQTSLIESESRLRMALDASQIGSWDMDLRTQSIAHSLRHDQCFGHAQPIAHWDVAQFFAHVHPDDHDMVDTRMQEVLRTGSAWQFDCRVIWPDGSVHWLATHGLCVMEDGAPSRLLGLVMDITERKQSEELRLQSVRLEAENQQIQEANRLKSEFLANMSHELRTPLNAVIGFADILRSGAVPPDSPRHGEYLGHVATAGRHLLQLINDVLDLAKVESGKFEFFPEPVDLPRLMHEIVGVLQTEASSKRIQLRTECAPDLDGLVLDPARLKQVLYNFLSNAIKFTDTGGHVVLRAMAAGPDHVRLEVEDNGVGIALADQDKLFTPFQQVNAGYAKQHQGTGLGLALTRRLAQSQGGHVGLRSAPGQGSLFYIELPRSAERHAALAEQAATRPAAAQAPAVLVIEDDVADQRRLVQALGQAGFQVDVAATGERALEMAAQRRYDAITLDLLLPDRSGLEVLSRLRDGTRHADVPVVVITMVTETSALAGFQVSDVLHKPVRHDEVIGALRRVGLRIPGQARIMVVDDDPAACELMAATLQSHGMSALCLNDGRAALRMLDEWQPDAMILDLLMPGQTGLDILHTLRQMPAHQALPVFIWTSMNLTPTELQSLSQSAQAIVRKAPGGLEAMLDRLQAWHASS